MKKITFKLAMIFIALFSSSTYSQSTINITTSGGSYASEKWINITTGENGTGTEVWAQGDGTYGNDSGLINVDISIAPGTYYVNCYDQYSDGWDGTLIYVTAYGAVLADNGGASPNDSTDNDASSDWDGPENELETSLMIVVPNAPSCPPPVSLSVANITEDSADISWAQGGSESSWQYALLPSTDPEPSSGTPISSMMYNATSLQEDTEYIFYLRSVCSGEFSTWVTSTFMTLPLPPGNDNCDSATPVTVGAGVCGPDVTGTNVGATDSGVAATSCSSTNYAGGDIWFEFTVPTGYSDVIYNRSASAFSTTYMALYSGSCGALTEIFCSSNSSFTFTGLTEGETYKMRLFDWGNDNFGDVTFCLAGIPSSFTPDYSSDFEVYPGIGWSEADGDYGSPTGTSSNWLQDDYGNDTGNANGKSARINIYGTGVDEYLVSPDFDLSSGNHYLNFDVALTDYNNSNPPDNGGLGADDYVALLVTQDGTNWSELRRWDSNSTIPTSREATAEIELSGYGATTKFAFYAFSDTSNEDNDFFIDNFQITKFPLSIAKNVIEGFSIYPNPAKDVLNLKALDNINEISIYNLLGQEVERQSPNSLNTEVTISDLPTGVYVVKVKVGEQLGTYKIVKE